MRSLLFVSLVACVWVCGCHIPKVTYKKYVKNLNELCPKRAVRICGGLKRKKALTQKSCEQEVRVWCGMEQRCLLWCQEADRRQRTSDCVLNCQKAQRRKLSESFQRRRAKVCPKDPGRVCAGKVRVTTFTAYEESLRKLRPSAGAASRPVPRPAPLQPRREAPPKSRPGVPKVRAPAARPTARRAVSRPQPRRTTPTSRTTPASRAVVPVDRPTSAPASRR